MKKTFKGITIVVVTLLVIILVYVAYVFLSYHRIADNEKLDIVNKNKSVIKSNQDYSISTYNIGYASYPPDYSFFMDGGKSVRANSFDDVIKLLEGISNDLEQVSSDFILLQEVDKNADRSYKVDQMSFLSDKLSDYSMTSAINYDSAYLFYPITNPIGKSVSGLMTFSKADIKNSTRYSLPIETTFNKFFDLDRAFIETRYQVNDKELVIYNTHLSAYIKDEKIHNEQIDKLLNKMQEEYDKGNYVIAGGDFNHDLLASSKNAFNNTSDGDYTWLKPFPKDKLSNDFKIVSINNLLVPSVRNLDEAYQKNHTFVALIDGFIVSDNVETKGLKVIDNQFKHSDHNPVKLQFKLK